MFYLCASYEDGVSVQRSSVKLFLSIFYLFIYLFTSFARIFYSYGGTEHFDGGKLGSSRGKPTAVHRPLKTGFHVSIPNRTSFSHQLSRIKWASVSVLKRGLYIVQCACTLCLYCKPLSLNKSNSGNILRYV